MAKVDPSKASKYLDSANFEPKPESWKGGAVTVAVTVTSYWSFMGRNKENMEASTQILVTI